MNAVIIALGLLLAIGIIISIAPALGIVSFFTMIYFFANGQMMYGICALVVWAISMALSEQTAFVSLRKW